MLPRSIIAIAVVAAFVSQDGSVQATNVSSTVPAVMPPWSPKAPAPTFTVPALMPPSAPKAPASTPSLSQVTVLQYAPSQTTTASASITTVSTGPTPAGTGSVSVTIRPTNAASSVIITAAATKPTCGNITFIWEKQWNKSYTDKQFAEQVSKTMKSKLLEKGFFNQPNKYLNVKVSNPEITEKGGNVFVELELCLIVVYQDGYIEDIVKKLDKLNDESIKELTFQGSGVTFKEWKAKDGECSKCGSRGAGGPFTIKRECVPKEYSCNGLKTTMKSQDCLKYCDSSAAAKGISSFILVLSIILSLSFDF